MLIVVFMGNKIMLDILSQINVPFFSMLILTEFCRLNRSESIAQKWSYFDVVHF